MRVEVTENSREKLRLRLRTNVLLYGFFGVFFVGLGLWCIRLLAFEARIVVEQQHLTYTRTCLWLFECERIEASGAELQAGLPAFELPQSNGDEKAVIAREVEGALSRPEGAFRHVEGSPGASLLLGLLCIVSGLVILLAIQTVEVVADRAAGTLRLTRRFLFRPAAADRTIALADIEAISSVPWTLRTGKHIVTSYSVRVRRRGETDVESSSLTFLPMFTQTDAARLAQTLRSWLGPR
ncbi:MAG: hypothetical protein ABW136_06450 [Steroidobacteraceae bacterium]